MPIYLIFMILEVSWIILGLGTGLRQAEDQGGLVGQN